MPERGGVGAAPGVAEILVKNSQGEVFLSGSGEQSLTVAGNFRLVINNPSTSTKFLHIFKVDIYATASGFAELLVGTPTTPLTGVPTTTRPINNTNFASLMTTEAQVFADVNTTTALAGGIDSGVSVGISTSSMTSLLQDSPALIIPPGIELGLSVPFSGAANATVNCFWFETPSG